MKKQNVVYIRVLMVVLSIVILLAFINRSPQRTQHDSWLPSSFNPVGEGNMALYETLADLKWPVDRWREPLSRLSTYGTDNVLVVTRSKIGANAMFSDQELTLLDEWVRKGNTLLLLGALDDWADTRSFMMRLGVVPPEKNDSVTDFLRSFQTEDKREIRLDPGPGTIGAGTMILPPTAPLPIILPPDAKVLWQADNQPYLVRVYEGEGRIVLGASARLLSNTYLTQGDNLDIVLRLLTPHGEMPHHIFFEESHHGFSAIYAIARLLNNTGVRFAAMLTLLGVLAFFGTSLVRFGPIIPLQRDTGRSTLEFVDSIADLYLRADQRDDTIRYLFTETHQQLLHRLNLPPTASHAIVAARLEKAHPRLPKWKKLAQRFDSHDYVEGLPPGGWLRVAKDLIEIKSATA